jgi:hypothetical protein
MARLVASGILLALAASFALLPAVPNIGASVTDSSGDMAVDCDASTLSIDTTCYHPVGQTFQIAVHVTDVPLGGFAGFQIVLEWAADVLDYHRSMDPASEAIWPGCDIPARKAPPDMEDGRLVYSCTSRSPQESTYTGRLVTFAMRCERGGTTQLALVPPGADPIMGTHFLDQNQSALEPSLMNAQVSCSALSGEGALAVDCDASTAAIETWCEHPLGRTFRIAVHATSAPADSYAGFQIKLRWPAGALTYVPKTSPRAESKWPTCAIPSRWDNQPDDASMVYGCAEFPSNGSIYTGPLANFVMECTRTGVADLALVPVPGDYQGGSQFYDLLNQTITPELSNATVMCGPVRYRTFTFTNTNLWPASLLTVSVSPHLSYPPTVVENAPGCSAPTITATFSWASVAWATPCVDPGESVVLEISSDGDFGAWGQWDLSDHDFDGCSDAEEAGPSSAFGGQRDALTFWDFFDVWTGDLPHRDRAITVADIAGVAARFGASHDPPLTEDEASAEALAAPASSSGYHAAFDRGGSASPDEPWRLLPPDGSIADSDIAGVVTQFGHSCAGPP